MAIARNKTTSGVALFVHFREDVEVTSVGIGAEYKVLECVIVDEIIFVWWLRYSLTRSCIYLSD